MRVFLSVFSGFTLAIPMDDVGAMMLYDQKTEKTIHYDQKSRCTFISLPCLFNMRDVEVPHGIILREFNSKENKVVLLTAAVKRDIEIPDEEFYPIPISLRSTNFAALFKGIKFSEKPILLLNMKQLPEILQREYQAASEKQFPIEQPEPEVVSKPAPPPPEKVVEEQPIVPVATTKPAPPPPKVVVEEPPIVPAATTKPAPPPPPKVVVEEPPIVSAVAPKPFPPPLKEVFKKSADIFDSSFVFDEAIELCEIIEDPHTVPAVVPVAEALEAADSSLVFDEAIELCDIIEEPPISLATASEPSVPIPNEVIEEPAEIPDHFLIDEAFDACDIIDEPAGTFDFCTADEDINVCDESAKTFDFSSVDEIIETCDVLNESLEVIDESAKAHEPFIFDDVIDESEEVSCKTAEPFIFDDVIDDSEEASDSLMFDEPVEICDVFD